MTELAKLIKNGNEVGERGKEFYFYSVAWILAALLLMAAKLAWGRHWIGVRGGLVLVNSTPYSKSLAFLQEGVVSVCL